MEVVPSSETLLNYRSARFFLPEEGLPQTSPSFHVSSSEYGAYVSRAMVQGT
jgi:hypothetical protein